MDYLLALLAIVLLLIYAPAFAVGFIHSLLPRDGRSIKADKLIDEETASPEQLALAQALLEALPNSVTLPHHVEAFRKSMAFHWANQETEVTPACTVRPKSTEELSSAIKILKQEYDRRSTDGKLDVKGLFAVRSGGHSPVRYAASIEGGVVIDLSLFKEVVLSSDSSTVVIGTGARWGEVSRKLDPKGLAVAGGRNSDVGVGGFLLGAGLSFFSPSQGFACSNVVSYETVLADGSVIDVTDVSHPDLWRALKGGSNNFGIVTRFTMRTFPCDKVWNGHLFMPVYQIPKLLTAFHEYVNRGHSKITDSAYDEYGAGPIVSISYVHKLGLQVAAANLFHAKSPLGNRKWPACWTSSGFSSLFRFWNTLRPLTLTNATDDMEKLHPSGRRDIFATTTIKNNHDMLVATHAAYLNTIASFKKIKVDGFLLSLVIQPLLPQWIRKGDDNPLGLRDYNEPLVIVNITAIWENEKDDELVRNAARMTIDAIEAAAKTRGTGHPWKYLNYCADWQTPFEGYGQENWEFLKSVSRKYDPDQVFQKACPGGFKLGIQDEKDAISSATTQAKSDASMLGLGPS